MVEIYTTANCGYCRKAKEFMQTNGVPFVERNATEHIDKILELTGRRTVPVFVQGNKVLQSSDPTDLKDFLGIE